MTQDPTLEKFKELYFRIRDKYIAGVLNGIDHYVAKDDAFSLITYEENQFFFDQLYHRNLTLYDCLSLEARIFLEE